MNIVRWLVKETTEYNAVIKISRFVSGFLNVGVIDTWGEQFFVKGGCLCTLGCLTAPLAARSTST